MFQDCCNEPVSIHSSWKKKKDKVDDGVQTSEVLTYENSCQSVYSTESAVQTDSVEHCQHPNKLVIDNSAELKEFLRKVEPMVCSALKRNVRSHAFDGYKVKWEEEHSEVTTTHTLSYPPCSSEFPCTGISWNSTGSVIAVSYGKLDHEDWCTHKSTVCTWNLDRRSVEPNKPDTIVEVPTCVMCCEFHPQLPSVIATGTFTGEVRVFNTGLEGDPLIGQTQYTELGHKEPIVQLSWLPDSNDRSGRSYLILSLGSDGRLLLWKWVEERTKMGHHPRQVSELQLIKGFGLKSVSIPQNIRVAKGNVKSYLGGSCFSFSSDDSSVVVVGCENGSLLKCSVDASSSDTAILESESDLQSPVRYAFNPHHGPVYGVSCSPFHRNLFLSCGLDTVTRLYSLLESASLLLIEPGRGYLFSVSWSPSRPLVIALGTGDGHMLMYDLQFSQIKPRLTIKVCDGRPVYCIRYNHNRHKVVATGDGGGVVKVHRLSSELSHQIAGENESLDKLAMDSIDTYL